MEENIMNVEETTFEEEVNSVDTYEPEEISEGGSIGKLAVAGISVIGAGVVLYKNRNKLKQKWTEGRIKKLEKQGYKVTKLDTDEVIDVEGSSVEETEEM